MRRGCLLSRLGKIVKNPKWRSCYMKGEPLLAKLGSVSYYDVVPETMIWYLFYSPPDFVSLRKKAESGSSKTAVSPNLEPSLSVIEEHITKQVLSRGGEDDTGMAVAVDSRLVLFGEFAAFVLSFAILVPVVHGQAPAPASDAKHLRPKFNAFTKNVALHTGVHQPRVEIRSR